MFIFLSHLSSHKYYLIYFHNLFENSLIMHCLPVLTTEFSAINIDTNRLDADKNVH